MLIFDVRPPIRKHIKAVSEATSRYYNWLKLFIRTSEYGLIIVVTVVFAVVIIPLIVLANSTHTNTVKFIPTVVDVNPTGELSWQNVSNIQNIDLSNQAQLEEFNKDNAAIINFIPAPAPLQPPQEELQAPKPSDEFNEQSEDKGLDKSSEESGKPSEELDKPSEETAPSEEPGPPPEDNGKEKEETIELPLPPGLQDNELPPLLNEEKKPEEKPVAPEKKEKSEGVELQSSLFKNLYGFISLALEGEEVLNIPQSETASPRGEEVKNNPPTDSVPVVEENKPAHAIDESPDSTPEVFDIPQGEEASDITPISPEIILPIVDGQNMPEESKQPQEKVSIFTIRKNMVISDFKPEKDRDAASTIGAVRFNLSMGITGRLDEDDELLMGYRVGDTGIWNQLATFTQNEDYSNFRNGDYFNYALPADTDLSQLKVEIFSLSNNDTSIPGYEPLPIYIDAAWVEVDYIDEITDPAVMEEVNQEEEFSVDYEKTPEFEFYFKNDDRQILDRLISLVFRNRNFKITNVRLIHETGFEYDISADISEDTDGKWTIKVPNADRTTIPGKYKIRITGEEDGQQYIEEQDFYWGVLAVNVNKSILLSGEIAYIQMAALTDKGVTICDADLKLDITSPDGSVVSPGVQRSGECKFDTEIVHVPDYFVYYKVNQLGSYKMKLSRLDKSGNEIHHISSSFEVQETVPFEVERVGPTRIYPLAKYKMKFIVKANENFTGNIIEHAPNSFAITETENQEYRIQNGGPETRISWNVDLKAGDTKELIYEFDAPDISPEFYLLGPLKIGEWREARFWQIAADATATYDFNICTTTCDTSTDWWASQDDVDVFPFGGVQANRNTHTEATDTEYSQVATSNDTRWTSLDPDVGDETIFWSEMKIDQAVADITQIDLTYEGGLANGGSSSTGQMYVLKTGTAYETDANWVAVGTTFTITTTEASFTKSITTGFSTYIGANGILTWVVASNTSSTSLVTDYVSAVVTYNLPAPVLSQNHYRLRDDTTALNTDGGYLAVEDTLYTPLRKNTTVRLRTEIANTGTAAATNYTYRLESALRVGASCGDDETFAAVPVTATTEAWEMVTSSQYIDGDNVTASRLTATGTFANGEAVEDPSNTTVAHSLTNAFYTEFEYAMQATSNAVDSGTYCFRLTNAGSTTNFSYSIYPQITLDVGGGRLFSSGFELQTMTDAVEWNVSATPPLITTTVKRSGNAAMETSTLVSGTSNIVSFTHSSSAINEVYFRAYLRIETAPSAENCIMVIQGTSGGCNSSPAWLTLDNSRLLRLYTDLDGIVGSASSALDLNKWYRIEMKMDRTGAVGSHIAEAKIDGTVFATASNRDILSGSTRIWLGGNLRSETQTTGKWYFDDVAVNKNVGATQNSYPGAGSIVHLKPNADGDTVAWTNTYINIDEVTPNDGTDAITTTTLNQVEEANLFDSSTVGIASIDTINVLQVGTRFRSSSTTNSTATVRIKSASNGTLFESSGIATNSTTWFTNANAVPQNYPLSSYTKPEGGAWTPSDLDTTQIGAKLTVDGGTNTYQISTMWLLVEYVVTPPIVDETHYRLRNDDGSEGGATDWYAPWGYRKQITIDYNKVGGNLTDFPVVIYLSSDTNLSTNAQADGDDILFTSSDGTTKLSHEIEKYVTGTGELVAWVKTNLSSTVNTTLYMYYGNSDISNQQSASAVWDINYKMVQHLEESSGSGAYLLDSTTNTNNGTPTSPTFTGTARIDGGRSFVSDQVVVTDNVGLEITGNLTISAWIYLDSWTDFARIISKKSTANNGYEIEIGDVNRYVRFETGNGVVTRVADSANSVINTGGWYYIAGVFDYTGTTGRVYVDGSQSGSPPSWTTAMATNAYDVEVGSQTNGGANYLGGTIDEVRISAEARSAAWISTEYQNQKPSSTFFTIGGEVVSNKATWKANEDISATVNKNENVRIRYSVKNTGATATNYNYRLQYSTLSVANCESEPTGNFADVPTSAGSAVIMASSSNVADGDATTRQLSIPASLTFTAGKVVTLSSNQTSIFSLNYNNFTEFEYAFKFTDTALSNTDYCFRLKNGAVAALDSYTKVAKITTAAGITVSGNVYDFETATKLTECDADSVTKELSLRAGTTTYTASCSNVDGSFSFTSVTPPAAGAGMVVWIEALATDGTLVIRYDGTGDSTGNVFYDDAVTVTSDDTAAVTNTNMDIYDNGNDLDIPYTVTATALTVNNGIELHVTTAKTYTPGGTITTDPSAVASTPDGDIHIAGTGTLNMEANALSVGGDFNNVGTMTFTSGQTTTFTATATGHTITDGAENFENVIFNGVSGGWSFADATTLNQDLTMTNGTLSGTVDVTVSGNVACGATCGTITLTGGIFLQSVGAVAKNFGTNVAVATNWTFFNLTFTSNAAVVITTSSTGTGTIGVTNALTISASSTMNAGNRTYILSGAIAAPFVKTGTFQYGTGTMRFTGNSASVVVNAISGSAGDDGYYNLEIKPSGAVTYVLAAGTYLTNNNLVIGDGAVAGIVSGTTNDPTINVSGNLTISASGTLIAPDAAGNTLSVKGNWLNSGTFTHSSQTVQFNGTATGKTINTGGTGAGKDFYNVTFNGSGGAWSPLTNTLTVANDLTMTAGTLDNSGGSANVIVNGAVAGTAGIINLTAGTFEQRVSAAKNFGTTSGTTAWTFNNLTFSNSHASTGFTVTTQTGGTGGITVNGTLLIGKSLDAAGATTTLDAGNRTWTLSGTGGDPFQILASPAGNLTPATSTFVYTGNNGAGNTTVQSETYNILEVNNGSEIYTLEATTASVTVTITAGTLDIGANALSATGDLTVTGTLQGTGNVTINGNVTGAGVVNMTGGTFEQIISGANKTFGSSSGTNEWIFSGLKFNNSDGVAARTITPNGGTGGTITVSGTLTLGDSGTQNITFDNETSNDRVFNIDGSMTISTRGVFLASSTASFTFATNLTNNGTFTANTGTVTIDGSGTSTFDGSGTPAITFNNLTSTTAGKTLAFTEAKTFRINGKLTISGASGNQIHIHSTSTTAQWLVNHQGTEDVTYAHIEDSGCAGGTTNISLNNTSTAGDSNNGNCWLFPSLTFSLNTTSISLSLTAGNNWTTTATNTLTVTTTATSGYSLSAYETGVLTHTGYAGVEIANYTDGGTATYAAPTVWTINCVDNANKCGFGYNTNDADVTQFQVDEYAPFSQTAPGDEVAKSTTPQFTSDVTTITYRSSVSVTQKAGPYTTTIIYIVTPQF